MTPSPLLIVEDEPDLRQLYELALVKIGLAVEAVGDVASARQRLAQQRYRVVVTDMRLPDAPRGAGRPASSTLPAVSCRRRSRASQARPRAAMHPVIERHRAELKALARRHGIVSISVFGSMARGDADEDSDVDLLVETAPQTSGFALGALLMDAQDILGRPVDVVTVSSLHPLLRERILREARPL